MDTRVEVASPGGHSSIPPEHTVSDFFCAMRIDCVSHDCFRALVCLPRSSFGTALEPAPITPTDPDAVPYKILSGTIKSTYMTLRADLTEEEKTIFVAPGIMSGNTGD